MVKKTYILIFTLISIVSKGQESNLIELRPSACDHDEDASRILDRISDIYFQHDTLLINVGFVANCGYADGPVDGDAKFKNDTLYLTYKFENEGDIAIENGDTVIYFTSNYYDCDCCFEFIYLIRDVSSTRIPISLITS